MMELQGRRHRRVNAWALRGSFVLRAGGLLLPGGSCSANVSCRAGAISLAPAFVSCLSWNGPERTIPC